MPLALFTLLVFALSWLVPCSQVRAADASYFFAAAQAYEAARYEDVLRSLAQGPETDAGRYLSARAYAALGRYAEALDRMSEAPPSLPQLVREDFLALRAEWAASAGRCADFLRFSSSVSGGSRAGLAGACAFRAGDFATAEEQLRSLKDIASRSMRAQALAKLERFAEAAQLARSLWLEHPAEADAQLWLELAQKEGPVTLTTAERLARTEAWLSARRADDAVRELESVREPSARDERAAFWHLRAEALFRTRRRYPEASKAFDKAASYKSKTEPYDAFHAIRALSRAGSDREAIKRYEKYARSYPKSDYAGEALYLSAWLWSRLGLPGAERKLEAVLQSQTLARRADLRRDLLWDLSWLLLSSNKPKQALLWLAKIPNDPRAMMPNAQREYWRGVALLESGAKADGVATLQQSLWVDPLGYYAQLAARRLLELGEEASPFSGSSPELPRPQLELPEDVRFYRRLGLMDDAARASERFTKGMKNKLSLVAAHSAVGYAEKSHISAEPMLSGLLRGPRSLDNAWLWQAAFPEPYRGDVIRESEARSLPGPLFYGHMQIESRYKPGVVSGAEAIGLMQLLPSTAQSVAKGLGIEVDRAALKVPAVNIRLAAAYLSGLLKRYGGQFPAAIAAYNAGTARVDGWLEKCPCELDRWVEDIPIEQTRNYVRRVITAWARYHYLKHPDTPWELGLPQQLAKR